MPIEPLHSPNISRKVLPPEMEIRELRVAVSLDTDDLVPAAGKRIRVLGFNSSQYVDSAGAVSTSLRSTLAFGEGHTSDPSKILASYRQSDPYDDAGSCMGNINVLGEIDEKVRLTNVTFTGGPIVTRIVIYYTEE